MNENQINKYYSMYDDTQQNIEDDYIPNIPKIDFDNEIYTTKKRNVYNLNNRLNTSKTNSINNYGIKSVNNNQNISNNQNNLNSSNGQTNNSNNSNNFLNGVTVNGVPAKDYLRELLYPNSNDIYDLNNYIDAMIISSAVSSKYCKNVIESIVTSTVISYGIFKIKKFIYEKVLR